ncbi:MAG: response regulator [bacterium]|nr:response regulator [bacterium]
MKKISVLFVDDEPWFIQPLIELLPIELNANVSIASTLETAIEILKEKQFDIIILDCSMPRPFPGITISNEVLNFERDEGFYAGLIFLKYIRSGIIGKLIEKPEIRNLPVIIYSVAAHEAETTRAVSKFENTRLCWKGSREETLIDLIRTMLQDETV